MENLKINEIIVRMCLAADAKNTVKLAEFLGYRSTGTISGWKKNGVVPDSVIAKISEKTRVSFEWLKTGEGEMRARQQRNGRTSRFEQHPGGNSTSDAPKPGYQLTPQFVRDVIFEVEAELDRRQTTLPPDKKAELVALICEEFAEDGAVNKDKIQTLIKLAV